MLKVEQMPKEKVQEDIMVFLEKVLGQVSPLGIPDPIDIVV